MLFSKIIKPAFLASLIISSSLMPACASVPSENVPGSAQTTSDTAAAITTTEDPNIPMNTLPEEDVFTSAPTFETDPAPDTEAPPEVTPQESETAAPATAPPETTQAPETAPAETSPEGEIIDDWRSGLELTGNENPDELYSAFGVDKNSRKGYYRMISDDTALPIVHITTENKSEIVSLDNYVNCFVEILNCKDDLKLEAASGGIRVRGNASANYGKVDWIRKNQVSYRIKFNEKQSMLGLNDYARCRSWVLLKSYEAAVENYLAFKIARAENRGEYFCSDSAFVQLYINEKYIGPYLLCEQTQANSNRVDINEAEDGYTGTDIGYLVELDNYATGDDHPYFYLNYNREEITDCYGTSRVPRKYAYSVKNDLYSDEQLDFIERYFEVAWEIPMRAIKYGEFYKYDSNLDLMPAQDEFASAYDCVNSVIDVNSVVDMYITYELVNDQDVGGGSFFFAVDFGQDSKYDRLTMVAPWDFDWAYYDYSSDADGGLYAARFKDSYFVENWGDRSNPWLILFYSADWFQELVKEKWRERLPEINAAIDDVENTVINYSDELNKDGTRRSGGAKTTINWVRDRIEYLNTLWG